MRMFLTISVLLLTGCNLSASLLDGSGSQTYTPTYSANGQQHTMTITFTLAKGTVTGLTIEPGAASGDERGHQLAFSANIRRYVLEKSVDAIVVPQTVGEETQLTEIFQGVIEKLKNDI
jgi:hypothetical protein